MHKRDYLIRRVVDGLSGWLVFQQALKANVTEHALYPAIFQIAQGRGWKVQTQQKLVRMALRSVVQLHPLPLPGLAT
jgi:hypothetical protein